jgi:hypothetical protein
MPIDLTTEKLEVGGLTTFGIDFCAYFVGKAEFWETTSATGNGSFTETSERYHDQWNLPIEHSITGPPPGRERNARQGDRAGKFSLTQHWVQQIWATVLCWVSTRFAAHRAMCHKMPRIMPSVR